MKVNASIVTIDGVPHIEGTMLSNSQELIYFVRAQWPDEVDHRPAVLAEVLKTISNAVAAGKIPLEGII